MTWEMLLVLDLMLAAFVSFLAEKIPPDLTGLGAFGILLVLGGLAPESTLPRIDALLGVFANPAALTVASMFILSAAVQHCGVLQYLVGLTDQLAKLGFTASLAGLILVVAAVSAFINNTPVVIMLAPMVIALAHKLGERPSRLLIPLSYASIFGGVCTLVGPSTNLMVNGIIIEAGLRPIGLFEIGKIGLPLLLVSSLYLLLFTKRLLPEREPNLARLDAANPTPTTEPPNMRRIVIVVAVILGVISVPVLTTIPIVVSALGGSVILFITGAFPIQQAYRAVDWSILVLIFTMLGLSIAMETTGTARMLVGQIVYWIQPLSETSSQPWVALFLLLLFTSILTEALSNNATAAIMTPLALGLATSLEVHPMPFIIAVCVAASASFATPIGYQTNTYVYRIGGYRFSDFARIGVPLNIIYLLVSFFLIPLIWSF